MIIVAAAIGIVFIILNLFVLLTFREINRDLVRQEKINEALAHYIAADLKQTWQKSAEELVEAIRGPKRQPPILDTFSDKTHDN